MQHTPLVSILINNYNYGRFLGTAIDSALGQTYPNIEVIVVDDGSTDDSRAVIAGYGDRIRAILKPNGGQASAFNAGFRASRGEILCFLDSDDLFVPEKVERIVAVFQQSPDDVGWCFHPLQLLDTRTGDFLGSDPPNEPTRAIDFREPAARARMPTFAPPTSGLTFRRSLLSAILPLFEIERICDDRPLKFAALGLSRGFFLSQELAIQKIHGANAFTLRSGSEREEARSLICTAEWLRSRFPSLGPMANALMAFGLGHYWRTGGVDPRYQALVRRYLQATALPEKLSILLKASYHANSLFDWLRRWRLNRLLAETRSAHLI